MKLKHISFASLAAVAVLANANSAHASVIDDGPTYSPPGSDLTLTAVQGIDAANPFGQGSFAPHVIQDFEDTPSIAVAYQGTAAGKGGKGSSGGLTDFGLGLYTGTGGATESTGLKATFSAPVSASSVTITVEDFDIKSNTAFNPQKVEPTISIFGAGGALIGTATPSQILANLEPAAGSTGAKGSKASSDIWNVNLGSVLATLGKSSTTTISGYLLAADASNGEKSTSDPYELVSAGQGVTPTPPSVPETSTLLPLLGVLGLIIGGPIARRRFTKLLQ